MDEDRWIRFEQHWVKTLEEMELRSWASDRESETNHKTRIEDCEEERANGLQINYK